MRIRQRSSGSPALFPNKKLLNVGYGQSSRFRDVRDKRVLEPGVPFHSIPTLFSVHSARSAGTFIAVPRLVS